MCWIFLNHGLEWMTLVRRFAVTPLAMISGFYVIFR